MCVCVCVQGWKIVWIPQDMWLKALKSKKQHHARHDILVDLTLHQGACDNRIIA